MTRLGSGLTVGAMGVVTVALVLAALHGTLYAAAAVLLAAFLLALAVLGSERLALVALAGAFATAPMYRGIGGIANVATPTDLLLLLGIVLLLPSLIGRRATLPPAFVLALGLLAVIGLAASALNDSPLTSVVYLLQWLLCLGVLPVALAIWAPSYKVVDGLLACYLAGHMVSLAVALVRGAAANGRYQGLSHHPNDFGLAAAVCVAIVLHLLARHRSGRARALLLFVGAASLVSLVLSGSRGATLAMAVVLVLVPIVERSGVWAFLGLACAALAVALAPYLLTLGGEGGSLSRLAGDSTASYSDSLREEALGEGWQRFLGNPFLGSGLDTSIGNYHNLYLEVALAVGVFGLLAYLVICYVLAVPLFGRHPMRRLCYLTWVFVVVGATFPGIVDRTIAVPLAVAVLAAVPRREPALETPRTAGVVPA